MPKGGFGKHRKNVRSEKKTEDSGVTYVLVGTTGKITDYICGLTLEEVHRKGKKYNSYEFKKENPIKAGTL